MYDSISSRYDATRRADPYIVDRIAGWLSLQEGCRYLDVGCGTGNYTVALAEKGGEWVGADLSAGMIAQARAKGLRSAWTLAKAEQLPYADGWFGGAICVLALHHFADTHRVFDEIYRVLGKGRLVVFTADPEQLREYWLNEYFPEAMMRSIEQMPSLKQITAGITGAGFCGAEIERYEVRDDLQDLFLYSGKYRPYLYLDQGFRVGISTFSGLAGRQEILDGCARLASDIEAGRFAEVANRYAGSLGDYMFIIASKSA